MLLNDLSDSTEIFIGATQAGTFRNYYLFNILKDRAQLFHSSGTYLALSKQQAQKYAFECTNS